MRSVCIPCNNAYQREWRAKNPSSAKASADKYKDSPKGKQNNRKQHLKNTYGLSPDEFEEMLVTQGNRCWICHRQFTGTNSSTLSACVDHCHGTGKIRGLLCRSCNGALGGFRDNPALLTRAIAYLEGPIPPTTIHHTAVIGRLPEHRDWLRDPKKESFPVEIEEDVIVQPFVTVDRGILRPTKVRKGTLLLANDSQVGRYCEIATGAIIGGHCIIGDGVKIGLGAIIRPGITIGSGARIGAGAVVIKNVEPYECWVGNPAKFLRYETNSDR